MAMVQFAMVEELASLVKDNLISKHLVLSTEEILVDFLQNDTSSDGVLELQPMGPYHRLLLHRLAEIFGFAHESVGEGDERHLVLERCPESAVPAILVSDILCHYDDFSSTSAHYILRREEAPASRSKQTVDPSKPFEEQDTACLLYPPSRLKQTLQPFKPFEEREAAYLAARERIFSLHEGDEKEADTPKPRKVPLVAQRMISHALGQKVPIRSSDQQLSSEKCEETAPTDDDEKLIHVGDPIQDGREVNNKFACKSSKISGISDCDRNVESKKSSTGSNARIANSQNREREQGAAKRIFAHALGLSSAKGNHGLATKQNERKKAISQETSELVSKT